MMRVWMHRPVIGVVAAAAAFVSMLLPLGVFFALQQYFVRGILSGSVKG